MGITFNASALLNGNGIDVTSIVNQIQTSESGQLTVWQQQQNHAANSGQRHYLN